MRVIAELLGVDTEIANENVYRILEYIGTSLNELKHSENNRSGYLDQTVAVSVAIGLLAMIAEKYDDKEHAKGSLESIARAALERRTDTH